MCLICNRASIAVNHEIMRWFEADTVKAAGEIGLALSHTAMMWHHYEIVDHFGGDIRVGVEEGKKALEFLDSARSRYAENRVLADDYGLDKEVTKRMELWSHKPARTELGYPGSEEEWEKLCLTLKKEHVGGLFNRMHKQVNELYDDLNIIVTELEQGKFPYERFGPHIAKWNDLLMFGHYASKIYVSLAK